MSGKRSLDESELLADLELARLYDRRRKPGSFWAYFTCCFLASMAAAFTSILLWSSMAWGGKCLDFVKDKGQYAAWCFALAFMLLSTLYLLDFFMPPHLSGRYCLLYPGDRGLGRVLLGIAVAAALVGTFFKARDYPFIPLLVNTFLGPAVVLLGSLVSSATQNVSHLAEAVTGASFQQQVHYLKAHNIKEKDQYNFYFAASVAFLLTGVCCLSVWVPWATFKHLRPIHVENDGLDDQDIQYILWMAPLVVGISNGVFASIVFLRVYLSQSYSGTHVLKNEIVMRGDVNIMNQELRARRQSLRTEAVAITLKSSSASQTDIADMHEAKDDDSHVGIQHVFFTRRLLWAVKLVGCILLIKLGTMYVTMQLIAANSSLALMAQSFLLAFFIFFVTFAFLSFRRVWKSISVSMRSSPLVRKAIEASESNLFRAAVVSVLLPLVPLVLVVSSTNQLIRRFRGLLGASGVLGSPRQQHQPDQQMSCLTFRVAAAIDHVRNWHWMPLFSWIYFLSLGFTVMMLSPILLNIFLAWCTQLLQDMDFGLLLGVTFLIGLTMFLLPPVPGAPIYFFAGAVFTQRCPWGFWPGAVVSVVMSWLLKLAACAMQQKLIGERLGSSLWVQRNCGVHKPFIRTIESVLRKPGMSIGKVAILCGGPDWPTSVLAGILRLSLLQMELGTTPIIFFVAPFSLSGSFYLKRDDGDIWTRAGNLMFTLTALVCLVLWAIMAWAWQNEFDENHAACTRPLEKYMHLDWLDFRAEQVRLRCTAAWSDLPGCVRSLYVVGALCCALVAQAFWWAMEMCFGNFAVTDDIDTMSWFGENGIVKFWGIIGLVSAAMSLQGLILIVLWQQRHSRNRIGPVMAELDAEEEEWKARRLLEIATAAIDAAQGSEDNQQDDHPAATPPAVRDPFAAAAKIASPSESTTASLSTNLPFGFSPPPSSAYSAGEVSILGRTSPGLAAQTTTWAVRSGQRSGGQGPGQVGERIDDTSPVLPAVDAIKIGVSCAPVALENALPKPQSLSPSVHGAHFSDDFCIIDEILMETRAGKLRASAITEAPQLKRGLAAHHGAAARLFSFRDFGAMCFTCCSTPHPSHPLY
mmetsp:Transcript_11331/g.30471  ORF Transcript_11331/g.30471 Transcript_11331/m.30471 type:complete len:1089 (+) Transcript_11331:52-3318(+)